VDGGIVQLGVPHGFLDGLKGVPEQFGGGPDVIGVEFNSFENKIELNICLSAGRQSSLGMPHVVLRPLSACACALDVLFLCLRLNLLTKWPTISCLSPCQKMYVSSSRLDLEDRPP